MVGVVKQRESIQNFLDFVNSFLLTERATIAEVQLVKANAQVLLERIQGAEQRVQVSAVDALYGCGVGGLSPKGNSDLSNEILSNGSFYKFS